MWLLYDNVCSTDINECLEFDSGGIGLSGSGSGDSQEVCRPDQRCMNTFGSFLCLCLPGFTSVAGACLGKSIHYATDVQTRLYLITSTQYIVFLFLNNYLATCINPLFLP